MDVRCGVLGIYEGEHYASGPSRRAPNIHPTISRLYKFVISFWVFQVFEFIKLWILFLGRLKKIVWMYVCMPGYTHPKGGEVVGSCIFAFQGVWRHEDSRIVVCTVYTYPRDRKHGH